MTLAALVLYVIANTVPMLGLTAVGREAFTTVVGGAQQLWHDGGAGYERQPDASVEDEQFGGRDYIG